MHSVRHGRYEVGAVSHMSPVSGGPETSESAGRMNGYLLKLAHGGHYLEYTPFDQSFAFIAAMPTYAAVFTHEAALHLWMIYTHKGEQVEIWPERTRRPAEFRIEDVLMVAA